jgi:Icc-related predicted phosphoesterase
MSKRLDAAIQQIKDLNWKVYELGKIKEILNYHKIYGPEFFVSSIVSKPIGPTIKTLEEAVDKIKSDMKNALSDCKNLHCPHYNTNYDKNCNNDPLGCKKHKPAGGSKQC